MQEKQLFEYAVIRVVPRVEREEFLNAGVILFCPSQKFLQAKFNIDDEKFKVFSSDTDISILEKNLQAFCDISKGTKDSGPIGQLDAASRFRWLTATRSTVVQASKVHPGFCTDPQETLERLFQNLVL